MFGSTWDHQMALSHQGPSCDVPQNLMTIQEGKMYKYMYSFKLNIVYIELKIIHLVSGQTSSAKFSKKNQSFRLNGHFGLSLD